MYFSIFLPRIEIRDQITLTEPFLAVLDYDNDDDDE